MTTRSNEVWAAGALVLLACIARFVVLNADPSMPTWIGYVVDEGRWTQSARSLALFGTLDYTAVERLHLFLAPGYQAVAYAVFRLAGIDFWSARLFSAITGALVVLVVFIALRRRVTPVALAVGIVLLGFESNLLAVSRMALPEIPSVLCTLLPFLLLVLGRKTTRNALAAGAIAAIGVAMKATTVLVVPVFPLILLLLSSEGSARARLTRALAFCAGFAALISAGLAFALGVGIIDIDSVQKSSNRLMAFLSLTGPYITMMRFFDSSDLEARNLLLLGAWFASWAWLHRDRDAHPQVQDLYVASGAWAAWWLIAWSAGHYFPGRYVVHFVVPATLHIVAGMSLLRPDLLQQVAQSLRNGGGFQRVAMLAWLVLPSALLLSAMASGVVERAGLDVSRLATRVGLLVAVAAVLTVVASRIASRPAAVAWFLAFPLCLTMVWLASRELGIFAQLWQRASDLPGVALGIAAAVALAVAAVTGWLTRSYARGPAGWYAVVALAAALLTQSAPAILAPTYTIREASRSLGREIAPTAIVRSFSAESLFLANALRYRTLHSQDRDFDVVVIFEHGMQSQRFFAAGRADEWVRAQTYPIAVNSRYRLDEAEFGPANVVVLTRRVPNR